MAKFLISALPLVAALAPEQIHLSLTGVAGEMAVDFVAKSAGQNVIFAAVGAKSATTVPADCISQSLNTYTAYFCTGLMTGLAKDTMYTYSVGNSAGNASFTFTNEPTARPPVFAVYADFGLENAESLKALYEDSKAGAFDAVIHAGDWAYDLDTAASTYGNKFMNSLQPYAATVPYMGVPGNHEAYGTQGGGKFEQFVARNRALAQYVGANCGSNTSLWYSFETPFVHWVGFTGETWTMSAAQLAAQTAWLDKDLAAVDRARTPWLVAFSHKAYMMDQTTWSLYDFLATYKFDVQFVGHWHQYTRYPPIDSRNGKTVIDSKAVSADKGTYTDAAYPTVIVTGAPGDQEVDPRTCTEANQIYCSGNYGYGYFQAVNATAAHWTWHTTVPVGGSPDPTFSDDLWFVKTA